MSLEEVRAALAQVSFGWPLKALSPSVVASETMQPGLEILLQTTIHTPDRNTGIVNRLDYQEALYRGLFREPADVHRWVLRTVENLIRHEVHESFLVNGVRVRDPHEDERPPPKLGRVTPDQVTNLSTMLHAAFPRR